MLTQDDGKGHVIIDEAALHLALAEKEVKVISHRWTVSHGYKCIP
ncbi:hypothetical protein ABEG90_22775 [Pantoea agglomerans]|nr:hypothetical protein [Pantoea agglomerans]